MSLCSDTLTLAGPVSDHDALAGEVFLSGGSQSVGTAVVRAVMDHLTGFKVLGVTRSEAALPVGASVTAIGELAMVPEATAAVPGALRTQGHVRAASFCEHCVHQHPLEGPPPHDAHLFALSRRWIMNVACISASDEGLSRPFRV